MNIHLYEKLPGWDETAHGGWLLCGETWALVVLGLPAVSQPPPPVISSGCISIISAQQKVREDYSLRRESLGSKGTAGPLISPRTCHTICSAFVYT